MSDSTQGSPSSSAAILKLAARQLRFGYGHLPDLEREFKEQGLDAQAAAVAVEILRLAAEKETAARIEVWGELLVAGGLMAASLSPAADGVMKYLYVGIAVPAMFIGLILYIRSHILMNRLSPWP